MKHILILPDGSEISSGMGETRNIRDVTVTESVNTAQELTIGSVCAAMAEITVFDPGGITNITAEEKVTLVRESDGIRVPVGVFNMERPQRKTANVLKLTGYDNVIALDTDLTAWLSQREPWPTTIADLAEDVCKACGLTMRAKNFANGWYIIDRFEAEATGRQLLTWIAEIACCFVRAAGDGEIVFSFYENEGKEISAGGEAFYFSNSFSYENYEVEPIDAVQVNAGDYLWPPAAEGANSYIITGNPLLQRIDVETLELLDQIKETVNAVLPYTPCKLSVPAELGVNAGTVISITDANGNIKKAIVMSKERKGLREILECTGSQRRDSTTAKNNKTESQKTAEQKASAEARTNKALSYQVSSDKSIVIDLENNRITIRTKQNDVEGEIVLSGSGLQLFNTGKEVMQITNLFAGLPIIYMKNYDENGAQTDAGELCNHHLKIGGTSLVPVFYVSALDGKAKLWINGENEGKELEWKDNNDGTFSLVGR